jgi:hypothetical protein
MWDYSALKNQSAAAHKNKNGELFPVRRLELLRED